jgi:gold/copper resistance efflux system membrane fusion protein
MGRSWIAPVGAAAAALAVALAPRLLPDGPGATVAATTTAPPSVEVAKPEVRLQAESGEFLGRLEATETVEVRARVPGVVEEVAFREGDLVRGGDLLFRLDPRPCQIALQQAEAVVRQKSEQLKLAGSRRKRASELLARAVTSQDAFEAAVAEEATLVAELDAAKAAVASAALNLEYTTIRAPIAGRVGATALTRGNHVSAGASAATPLVSIVAVDQIRVVFHVDEASFLKHLARDAKAPERAGLTAKVALAGGEPDARDARIDFVDTAVDGKTGTVRVRGLLSNPGGALAPGLFARVKLAFGPPRNTLLIEERAVAATQNGRLVLVVNGADQVEARSVVLGASTEAGRRVVLSGLGPEDRIVLKGSVRPGMKVLPVTTVASSDIGSRP